MYRDLSRASAESWSDRGDERQTRSAGEAVILTDFSLLTPFDRVA